MNARQHVQTAIGISRACDGYQAGVQAARAALAAANGAPVITALAIASAEIEIEAVERGVREVVVSAPMSVVNPPVGESNISAESVQVFLVTTADAATQGRGAENNEHGEPCEGCTDVDAFRSILDALPFGVFWKSASGEYLGCNMRFAKHAGLSSPAEVVGRTDEGFSWAAYAETYAETDREVIETGRPQLNLVEPAVRVDGQRVWIRMSKFPLRDAAGRVIGFIGVYEDVSALRDALEEIAEGELTYREIFNAANDAMFIHSDGGSILDANERACELFGYSREELVRITVAEISHGEPPYSAAEAIEQLNKVAEAGSHRMEWLCRRSDGERIWVDVSLRLAHIEGRACIISSMRDVTERKQMEEELRNSRERYHAYFQTLPDAAGVSRACNGELIEVNETFVKLFGWSREEIIGRTSIEIGLWADPEDRARLLKLASKSPEGAQCEYTYRNSRGETGIGIFCFKLFTEDNERFIYFICKDITDRKRAEDAVREQAESLTMANMQLEAQSQHLRAQQEDLVTANKQLEISKRAAEVASRAKSEFLTTMSHELLTPLTAILGYAEHLGGGPDVLSVDPVRASAIETILRNGRQLHGILSSILDLSKIDSGEFNVESSLCSPRQIIDEVRELLLLKAERKNLKLRTQVTGMFPSSVETDPTRLRQVLIHLVDNAVKFTEKGEISVKARIKYQPDKRPFLEIEVRDTGVGMTEEVMERLFQPFSQADMSCARQFQGTGLGLSICKRVCQLLGGDISVNSEAGQGSTFVATFAVTIPANALPVQPIMGGAPTAPQAESDTLSCRILLAEDSIDNQRLFSVILNKAGVDLVIVEDGRQAIDAIAVAESAGTPFDLVLMDMQMPELDGYEATKHLRESGFNRPILALTAHSMVGDRERCIEAGCTDYATKPIRRDALIAMIQTLLERDIPARP